LFDKIDSDNSGEIDLEEWLFFLKTQYKQKGGSPKADRWLGTLVHTLVTHAGEPLEKLSDADEQDASGWSKRTLGAKIAQAEAQLEATAAEEGWKKAELGAAMAVAGAELHDKVADAKTAATDIGGQEAATGENDAATKEAIEKEERSQKKAAWLAAKSGIDPAVAELRKKVEALTNENAALKEENARLKCGSTTTASTLNPSSMLLPKAALQARVEMELARLRGSGNERDAELHQQLLAFRANMDQLDAEMDCDTFCTALASTGS